MAKDSNIRDAVMALDMVHADLWSKLEVMIATKNQNLIVKKHELEALLLLVGSALQQLGHNVKLKIE